MTRGFNLQKLLLLFAMIALCESVGVVGSYFTAPSISEWYVGLAKPSFTPPSWIFGPVWTLLYAMMGVAIFLILQKRGQAPVRNAVVGFVIQLILNGLWTPAFFGMRSIVLGFLVIVPLLISIVITTALFYRISKPATWLMLPYLIWVSFATVLNYSLMRLN